MNIVKTRYIRPEITMSLIYRAMLKQFDSLIYVSFPQSCEDNVHLQYCNGTGLTFCVLARCSYIY